MTKTNIKAIINENNKNKDIHWDVLKNTKSEIIITNDYDSDIRFKINLKAGEGNDIQITDESGCYERVGYLIHGSEFWCDFIDIEEGIKKAIIMVVRFFYYYY